MSWQFVFNSRYLTAGTDIRKVYEAAKVSGYRFFLFNGMVYFMTEDYWYSTGIKAEDLY